MLISLYNYIQCKNEFESYALLKKVCTKNTVQQLLQNEVILESHFSSNAFINHKLNNLSMSKSIFFSL